MYSNHTVSLPKGHEIQLHDEDIDELFRNAVFSFLILIVKANAAVHFENAIAIHF